MSSEIPLQFHPSFCVLPIWFPRYLTPTVFCRATTSNHPPHLKPQISATCPLIPQLAFFPSRSLTHLLALFCLQSSYSHAHTILVLSVPPIRYPNMNAFSAAFQPPITICHSVDIPAPAQLPQSSPNSFKLLSRPRRKRHIRPAPHSSKQTVITSLATAGSAAIANTLPPPSSAVFADCPVHLATSYTHLPSHHTASVHSPLVIIAPSNIPNHAQQTPRLVSVTVTGVSKQPIHDYPIPDSVGDRLHTQPSPSAPTASSPTLPAYLATPRTPPPSNHGQRLQFQALSNPNADSDDARREFMLAARLVTASMMGVMLGVERRATKLYLSVRSITVLSVVAALTTVLVSTLSTIPTLTEASIHNHAVHHPHQSLWPSSIPLLHLVATPAVATLSVATLTALMVYATARAVAPNKQKIAPMSAAVASAVGMGVASGAACPLLTAAFYLMGVAVMRSSQPPRTSRTSRTARTSCTSRPSKLSPQSTPVSSSSSSDSRQ